MQQCERPTSCAGASPRFIHGKCKQVHLSNQHRGSSWGFLLTSFRLPSSAWPSMMGKPHVSLVLVDGAHYKGVTQYRQKSYQEANTRVCAEIYLWPGRRHFHAGKKLLKSSFPDCRNKIHLSPRGAEGAEPEKDKEFANALLRKPSEMISGRDGDAPGAKLIAKFIFLHFTTTHLCYVWKSHK